MRALLAFDKFKDSLTALNACNIAANALRELHPDWTLDVCPLADGGEGFAEILTRAAHGSLETVAVMGPRGGRVTAQFGFVAFGKIPPAAQVLLKLKGATLAADAVIAVIEMAAASGLALVPPEQRDPWEATTFGTGELIAHAAGRGAKVILVGVGGSATSDLGLGAVQALGLRFKNVSGQDVSPAVPARWSEISTIDGAVLRPFPTLRIACDVENPLLGPRGAAAVYGPQKGLKVSDVMRLDHAAARVGLMLSARCGKSDALMDVPGAGAAGGLPFGLMTAADAELLPGYALVAAWLDVESRLSQADIVITGEGRFDDSSLSGKGPGSLLASARRLGKPAHIFAGAVNVQSASAAPAFFLHAITPTGMPLSDALARTAANLHAAVKASFA